jgi:hypothetical protein
LRSFCPGFFFSSELGVIVRDHRLFGGHVRKSSQLLYILAVILTSFFPVWCGRGVEPTSALFAAATAQQQTQTRPVISDPQEALEALLAGVRRFDKLPAYRERVKSIREDAEWLRKSRRNWPPANYSGFTLDIELDLDLLNALTTGNSSDLEQIRIVAQDVNIKRRQCRQFGGPRTVSVSVSTKDNSDHEVGGFEVWFVKKGYEKQSQYYRSFPTYSSPARLDFPDAGYYVLWAARPGEASKIGVKRDVEVGPGRQVMIDLTLPSF